VGLTSLGRRKTARPISLIVSYPEEILTVLF